MGPGTYRQSWTSVLPCKGRAFTHAASLPKGAGWTVPFAPTEEVVGVRCSAALVAVEGINDRNYMVVMVNGPLGAKLKKSTNPFQTTGFLIKAKWSHFKWHARACVIASTQFHQFTPETTHLLSQNTKCIYLWFTHIRPGAGASVQIVPQVTARTAPCQ